MAFPKASNGKDMMMDAPATVATSQLDDLHISIKPQ
jgi:aspartyl-tRNA synthetase